MGLGYIPLTAVVLIMSFISGFKKTSDQWWVIHLMGFCIIILWLFLPCLIICHILSLWYLPAPCHDNHFHLAAFVHAYMIVFAAFWFLFTPHFLFCFLFFLSLIGLLRSFHCVSNRSHRYCSVMSVFFTCLKFLVMTANVTVSNCGPIVHHPHAVWLP